MAHGIRTFLAIELANEQSPPIGDIVGRSVRHGQRKRRNRRVWMGAGMAGAATIAAVFAGSVVGLLLTNGAGDSYWGVSPRVGENVSALSESASTAPTGQLVKATPASVLELLTRLLPPGKTSGYGDLGRPLPFETPACSDRIQTISACFRVEPLHVQIYLDRGQGPGMIRLTVRQYESLDALRRDIGGETCPAEYTCRDLPGRGRAVFREGPDGNCIQARIVVVEHANGVMAYMDLASCLAWNGSENPPGSIALTIDEAIGILSDPRWGARMPKELVDAGARRFPSLPGR